MRYSRLVQGFLVAGLAAALSGMARADFTPPQTQSIPLTQTNWTSGPGAGSTYDNLIFNQFDHTLYDKNGLKAVLESVQLSVTYEFDNTIIMRFDNVSTIKVNANGNLDVTLPTASGGNSLLGGTKPSFTHSETLTSTPSDVFSKTVTLPMTPPVTGTVTNTLNTSTFINPFIGNGTIDLPAFAQAFSDFTSSSGNGAGSSLTYASATVKLVYEFALVPEPSSFVLMGLGMVGLAAVVRGRSRVGLKTTAMV